MGEGSTIKTKSYGIPINWRAAHMHSSAKPILEHPSTGWSTSLVLAPAATLTEGLEQDWWTTGWRHPPLAANIRLSIRVTDSTHTLSPLTHENYQERLDLWELPEDAGTLLSLSFGIINGGFKFLHEEAELHGAAEIAGDVSHRKCSGLWSPVLPYCRRLQPP